MVLTRSVELGEQVAPGSPLFSLVDLDRLYLKVYVPEPLIGQVALGQRAEVRVDAYPDRAFAATVTKVATPAEFTPKNVETKEERVKLVFAVELSLTENPGGVLKPGMPADGRDLHGSGEPRSAPAAQAGRPPRREHRPAGAHPRRRPAQVLPPRPRAGGAMACP